MSRRESDREDLLREATALIERVELQLEGRTESVVVGFRRNGAASFLFGADRVYQFNDQREFRRGYLNGQLLKAEKGSIVALTRNRTAAEVQLLRREFTPRETEAYLRQLGDDLNVLRSRLEAAEFELIGRSPENADVVARVNDWLRATLADPLRVAERL